MRTLMQQKINTRQGMCVNVWTGLSYLRIRSSGGLL